MSRFRQELQLVPKAAWVIGVLVWLGFVLLMMLIAFRHDPEVQHWPLEARLALSVLPGLPLLALALMVGYIYNDARRRGMRYVMWTLLAALIPNAIGVILYFVLREPLLAPCRRCGTPVKQGYAFCQNCGSAVGSSCPQCRRRTEPGWMHCVYCGADLRGN
jgi:hypothetical protein